jgi:hypothetical protein
MRPDNLQAFELIEARSADDRQGLQDATCEARLQQRAPDNSARGETSVSWWERGRPFPSDFLDNFFMWQASV